MNTALNHLKKIFVLAFAAFAVSIAYVANAPAQASLLQQIANNTFGTMGAAQQILSLLQADTANSLGNSSPDDGKNGEYSLIIQNFGYIYSLAQDFLNSQKGQEDGQRDAFANLIGFGDNPGALGVPIKNPVLAKLPNANELAYGTLIGQPPVNGGGYDLRNYLNNIAVMNINRPLPDPVWQGKDDDKKKYINYYNTVTSLQSLNTFLLTQIKTDYEADKSPMISGLEKTLLTQFSDPNNFLKNIASQNMGKVYRQMLFIQAANFILNIEMQRNIRQLVAATAAQNSLMILFNIPNENQMIRNAKGLQVGT